VKSGRAVLRMRSGVEAHVIVALLIIFEVVDIKQLAPLRALEIPFLLLVASRA